MKPDPSIDFGHDSRAIKRFACAFFITEIVFVLLFTPQSLLAARAKLYPVDEAAKDPSLVAFRNKLLCAAQTRDIEFVLSVLDPEIVNSFGGDEGIEGFKRIWEPEKPDTRLWHTLAVVLAMGGSYYSAEQTRHTPDPRPEFSAPYVFSRWPGEFDAFEHAAITGKNVNLRSEPSARAPVLAKLSYEIVKLDGYLPSVRERESASWVKIKTQAGLTGYVSRRFIYSPIDYRARFVKREGKWRITSLVAGD